MAQYNGHKNWTHWNVALWINNDEYLYNTARQLCKTYNRDKAAWLLLGQLAEKTPDGASYSFTSVRAALIGMI